MTDEIVLGSASPKRVFYASVEGTIDGHDSACALDYLPVETDTVNHDVSLFRWTLFPPEHMPPPLYFTLSQGIPAMSPEAPGLVQREDFYCLGHNWRRRKSTPPSQSQVPVVT